MLIYVIAQATGPTILVTVGTVTRQVTSALLGGFFGLLKLLFGLLKFLGQISHLARVTSTLFPRLFCGIKGLTRLAYLFAFLVEPTTLTGVLRAKGPTRRLVPLAVLGGAWLLGGWSSRPPSSPVFSGHVSTFLGGYVRLGLVGSSFLVVFFNKDFLNVLEIVEH